MSESSLSRFVSSHKVAIAVTAVVGAGSVAGLAYYLSQQNNSTIGQESSKKKKKSKSKKKKKSAEEGGSAVSQEWPSEAFAISAETGLPEVTAEGAAKLSSEEKDQWALALKEAGNSFFKKKDFDTAISCYTAAITCKVDPVFYANRAACYSALGDNEKSIDDCTKALEISPDYSKCLLRRAHAYENIEKYDEAMYDLTALTIYGGFNDRSNETSLERVLKKLSSKINEEEYSNLPKELPSSSSLSSFFGAFRKEDVDLGESQYEPNSASLFFVQALSKMSADTNEGYQEADVLFNQAVAAYEADSSKTDNTIAALIYEYKGAYDFLKTEIASAVVHLDKALELNARPRTHVILGLINADRGDYISSEAEFLKAIKLNPEDSDIYYHYGQIYYLMGDLSKAKSNFEKAKELSKDNVYAYIQLACIAYRQGETEKCDQLFKAAKTKFPTSPEIPNYYGEILFDKQDLTGASKQFDTAARLQEALPSFNIGCLPLINKSAIYQRSGNMEECIKVLSKACDLDPKSEVARINLGQVYLQQQRVEEAIKLFKEACVLSRTTEDRTQAISLMEASKMQLKIKQDPVLSKKVEEIMRNAGVSL